ncbi:MAG: hypothetical protein ACRDKH_04790, partial [Solirubrobacterales bacterium]
LRVLGPDSTVSFGPADVHRIHHDPADGNAISIHAYTPALSEPRDYGFGPDGTLRVITPEPELQPA